MRINTLKRIGFYLLLALIVFVSIAPFYWQFVSSISLDRDLLQRPPQWVPKQPVFFRYAALLGLTEDATASRLDIALANAARNFRSGTFNSLVVASTTTLISLVLGTLGAYAVTRLKFPGRKAIFLGGERAHDSPSPLSSLCTFSLEL